MAVYFQVWDAVIFAAGTAILAGIFLSVAWRARAAPLPYDQVAPRGYRVRRYWFLLLLAAALVALATTLPRVPYASFRLSAYGPGANPLVVHVRGEQWAWLMQPSSLPAGRVVRLEVTSADVNHDFGIYDPDGHIVGQVQAMPGYTNVLVMRFDRPGSYQIRCLELCGQYHHIMIRGFEVT
jgi:cytochrome c oxidase subunit 2